MSRPAMLRVALTGGIATGQELRAGRRSPALGVPTHRCRRACPRRCSAPGTAVTAAVAERFGPGIAGPDGASRPAARSAGSSSPTRGPGATSRRIVHPAVYARDRGVAGRARPAPARRWRSPTSRCCSRRAGEGEFDAVIVVACDPARQVRACRWRATGCPEAEARARLAAQWPIDEKVRARRLRDPDRRRASRRPTARSDVLDRLWRLAFAQGSSRAEVEASVFRFRRVLRRRDPLLDERVPLVAVRALPEQLRAAVAAAHADVRIEVEDRRGRSARRSGRRAPARGRSCRSVLPDRLVDGERVRIVRRAPRTAARARRPACRAAARCRASARRARQSCGLPRDQAAARVR